MTLPVDAVEPVKAGMVQVDHARGSFRLWHGLPVLRTNRIEHFFRILVLLKTTDNLVNVVCNLLIHIDKFGIVVCQYGIFRRKRKKQRRAATKGFNVFIILCGHTGDNLIKHLPFPASPL